MTTTNSIFSSDFKTKADALLAKYETKRATLLEMLHLVQEEYGHITREAEKEVAQYLGIAPIDVREVMTFYSLYYDKPRAKVRFNVCRTLTCSLLGAEKCIKHLEEKIGIKAGQVSADGKYSIQKVECLGACELAPMMQVNDDEFIGKLTIEKIDQVIQSNTKG